MRDGVTKSGFDAESALRSAVGDIFGPLCRAAWLSGSFVYEGAKPGFSDVDVVIVLGEEQGLPAKPFILDRIRAFIDPYLEVHARLGLDPDLDFPAEYVVPATLHQAIAWRGLAMDGRVASAFPPVETEDYWIGRPDRWFHAWVSMTAFSRFLFGDKAFHQARKLDAWICILRFILLRSERTRLEPGNIWPMLAQFGAKPSYRTFWTEESETMDQALDRLEVEEYLVRSGKEIRPNLDRLRSWEAKVNRRIAGESANPPLLLPPGLHRSLGEHAARRWRAMMSGPVAQMSNRASNNPIIWRDSPN